MASIQPPTITVSPIFAPASDSAVTDAAPQSAIAGGNGEHGWRSPAVGVVDDDESYSSASDASRCNTPSATSPSQSPAVDGFPRHLNFEGTPLSFSNRKRQRAPAPGSIDLSFLSTYGQLSNVSSNPAAVPSRPPRPKPTPALSGIVTPAAGWFSPESMAEFVASLGCLPQPQTVEDPLSPTTTLPSVPRNSAILQASGRSLVTPPAPTLDLSSSEGSQGYFAESAPRSGSSIASPDCPTSASNQKLPLLAVERPKLLRSRFSSVDQGSVNASEGCEAVGGKPQDVEGQDNSDEDEVERWGDGWTRANRTRKRVLLEWEATRAGHGPSSMGSTTSGFSPCSASTTQSCGPKIACRASSTLIIGPPNQFQRQLNTPLRPSFARSKSTPGGINAATVACHTAVFASSPLAGKAIVPIPATSPGTSAECVLGAVSMEKEGGTIPTPSRPPNMRRSTYASTGGSTASPLRKSLSKAPACSAAVATLRPNARDRRSCGTDRPFKLPQDGPFAGKAVVGDKSSTGLKSGFDTPSSDSDSSENVALTMGLSISFADNGSTFGDLPDTPSRRTFSTPSPWERLVAESLASFTPPLVPMPGSEQPDGEVKPDKDSLWESKMSGYFASMVA